MHFLSDGDYGEWRPVVYVIPQVSIPADRIRILSPPGRAGFAREYIITDLHESEFDFIEI
jgi:hypothetical protein